MNAHRNLSTDTARPTMDVLGINVLSLGWQEALDLLGGLIAARDYTPVAFLNAHNANIASTDPDFAAALDRFIVLPDGIGVDIAAKLLHGSAFPANLNGTDFIPALFAAIARPMKVGLIGATMQSAAGAAKALASIAPQHGFEVVSDGFFKPEDEPAVLDRIAKMRPDVLLVAMGVPKQEFWVSRKLDASHCTMPIAVGALFDLVSGQVQRAPEWTRRLRMEWVYRLWVEPRRLWRRYVLGNPLFLYRVLRQKLGGSVRSVAEKG